MTKTPADIDDARDRAAAAAVGEVTRGMVVGLGSGDTASRAIIALGRAQLGIIAVASSEKSAALGRQVGLDVRAPDEVDAIDLTIDGADEIDAQLRLIKGAGGALTREKMLARASRRLVIVADDAKRVTRLGQRMPLPVEILAFASRWTLARLTALGLVPKVRAGFFSDNGGVIADCALGPDVDPVALTRSLDALPGVIEHGLFLDEAAVVYLGNSSGVERLTR